jgi:hypothetical protein
MMVPRVRAARTSSVLQTDAFTGLASRAARRRKCATSQFGADGGNRTRIAGVALQGPANRPRPRLRWWVTRESNTARAKAQALQARSVTRLGVTRNWLQVDESNVAQSGL